MITHAEDYPAFRENVDCWIKEFNSKMTRVSSITDAVAENVDNTNHNYEMIQEMKKQLDALQQEVKTMKLMQLLAIKKAIAEEK
jgi:hypothetical protein